MFPNQQLDKPTAGELNPPTNATADVHKTQLAKRSTPNDDVSTTRYRNADPPCLDWSRRENIQARTVRGRLSWTGRRYLAITVRGRPSWFCSLLPEVQGTSSWFISWMLEQHEDQAQSMKSSSSAESRTELKSIIEAQNDVVENGSIADQVQFGNGVKLEPQSSSKSRKEQNKLRFRQKEAQIQKFLQKIRYINQLVGISWEWSKAGASKQLEEQERTEQAQVQTKRGADTEVSSEDRLEYENKEAGEDKERPLQEPMKQPA
ncbi:serum factor response C-like [Dorcoceras hygrometricum]|uniref:Serum factor response C-like n=1 Tax=Dorcoceras hygrometricum TaxID=472368 RepID=A0A2Z7BKS8_9LAMI|nr:serum factor response C-like [Dorcoceras hygrometricum]